MQAWRKRGEAQSVLEAILARSGETEEDLLSPFPVAPEEVPGWQARALVGNVQRREGDVLLRIVGDSCPGGDPAAPDLEDVYLYHFQESSGMEAG